MQGAMLIEDAIDRILEDGDGDCLYSNFTLIASFTLSIFVMVFALETNMLTYVAPCAVTTFFPDASFEEMYIKETGLWDALYYGELVGSVHGTATLRIFTALRHTTTTAASSLLRTELAGRCFGDLWGMRWAAGAFFSSRVCARSRLA